MSNHPASRAACWVRVACCHPRLFRPGGQLVFLTNGVILRLELRVWETVYSTIRPHQALGYLTPADYLASVYLAFVGIAAYRTC